MSARFAETIAASKVRGRPIEGNRVLNMDEVIATTGLSIATINRRVRSGQFPQKVRLGVHRIGFREQQIIAWIEAQACGPAD